MLGRQDGKFACVCTCVCVLVMEEKQLSPHLSRRRILDTSGIKVKIVSTLQEHNVEKTSVLSRAILSLGQMFSAWPRGDRAFLGSL